MNKRKKREKKEMSTTKKFILFVFIIIIVIALIGVGSYFILEEKDDVEEVTKTGLDEIAGYGITLDDLDTELYRTEFYTLKENLENDNIDYDAYAESVAKMFIIDLYTIDNKLNKYDVGGTELVYPEGVDNYTLNVEDTLYNYVEDNTDGERDQDLPTVKEVNITNTETGTFTIESLETEYSSYTFTIDITYEDTNDYDKTAEVIVINYNNFMYVVEKN